MPSGSLLNALTQVLGREEANELLTNSQSQQAVVTVKHVDGTSTSYYASANTDAARHTAWATAAAALVQYDRAFLSGGNYLNATADGPTIAAANVVIEGVGPNATILQGTDGNNAHSVLTINANNVELRNLQVAVPVTANVNKGVTIGLGAVLVDGLRIINCIIAGSADTMLCSGCATNFYSCNSFYYTWFDGFFASIQGEFDNCTFVAGSSTVDYPNNTTVFRARKNTVNATGYPTQIILRGCNLTVQTNTATTSAQLYCFKGAANCTLAAYDTTFTTKNYNATTTQGGNIWGVLIGSSSCSVYIDSTCSFNVTSADGADTGSIYDIDNTSAGTSTIGPFVRGSGTNGALLATGTMTKAIPASDPHVIGQVYVGAANALFVSAG